MDKTRSPRYSLRKRKAKELNKKKKPVRKKKRVSFIEEEKENVPKKNNEEMIDAEEIADLIANTKNVVSVRNVTDNLMKEYTGNSKEHDKKRPYSL